VTSGAGGGGTSALMNFFVSSKGSPTANGNLGGLTGADQLCQTLAAAVGQGSKTWRAYLSVVNPTTINARDRIGEGPYYNAKGAMIAATKTALHSATGDANLFLDERGNKINGQWTGSPTPNQHDIYTGSDRAGMLAGADMTCSDWTNGTTGNTQVGHSDGLGPGGATTGNYTFWSGTHASGCADPTPAGGAGKIYCFVGP